MLALLGQQFINALSVGSIYALIAVGYSLIYSILQFSNFAHGSFLVIGAYTGFYLLVAAHLPLYASLGLAMVMGGLAAILTDHLAYRPVRDRGSPTLYFIIASMGVAVFCENMIIVTIGPRFRGFPPTVLSGSVSLGQLTTGWLDLFSAAVAAACLVLLELFIARTKLGFAIRAASFDLEAAGLMGVNVNGLVRLVFFIAGFLAGLAGVCLGMKYTVFPQLGAVTIKAFVAAVAGGLGSLPGAIMGSFVLGALETFVVAFISSRIRDIVVFAVLITVLLVRPSGFLGKRVEEKV